MDPTDTTKVVRAVNAVDTAGDTVLTMSAWHGSSEVILGLECFVIGNVTTLFVSKM
jgi:phosphoheptose isomerase